MLTVSLISTTTTVLTISRCGTDKADGKHCSVVLIRLMVSTVVVVLIRLTVSTVVVITGCSQSIKLNFYSTNIPGIARLSESCNIISTVSK